MHSYTMFRVTSLFHLVTFMCLFNACLISSSWVKTVFLFGDSILDAGNNAYDKNCTTQANFPPYGQDFFHRPTGRFTNGRTVADFIAQELGLDLQKPYLEIEMLLKNGVLKEYPANGINFASAGSGVVRQTNDILGVTPLQVQLQQFETLVTQNKIDKETIREALYVFESASNNVFSYFFPTGANLPAPDEFVRHMLSEFTQVVQHIYDLGAQRIAIFGLGPVGCIPARLILPNGSIDYCNARVNEMVADYNIGLVNLVNELPARYNGVVPVYADVFDVVELFLTYPQQYGFNETLGACCGSGTLRGMSQCGTGQYDLCKDPNQYIFWDFFHPTEHAYNLIFRSMWNGDSSKIRPMNLKTLVNMPLPPRKK